MTDLLKSAIAERKELQQKLAAVEKVIILLGGEAKPKSRRHKAATREKMRAAWAKRKARANKDSPSMVLSVRKDTTEPTIEERQAAAIAKLAKGKD